MAIKVLKLTKNRFVNKKTILATPKCNYRNSRSISVLIRSLAATIHTLIIEADKATISGRWQAQSIGTNLDGNGYQEVYSRPLVPTWFLLTHAVYSNLVTLSGVPNR